MQESRPGNEALSHRMAAIVGLRAHCLALIINALRSMVPLVVLMEN